MKDLMSQMKDRKVVLEIYMAKVSKETKMETDEEST